jgi:uncharacterized MnhB-related membrane protein
MTSFWILDYLILAVALASAVLVVRLRNLNGAVMALSAVGTMLSLLFIVLGAPDVAHAEVVVGAIALPVLYLVAIGKTRAAVPHQPELEEQQARDSGQAGADQDARDAQADSRHEPGR